MTNKPMLSVELRAFLEGVVKLCSVHGPTYNELRALLDKEVDGNSHAPEKHGEPVAEVERVEGDLPHVQLYQDLPDGTKLYAEQPAPLALVMPERKTKADYSGYIEQFQSEAAGLYNSALDDVARLSGVKP